MYGLADVLYIRPNQLKYQRCQFLTKSYGQLKNIIFWGEHFGPFNIKNFFSAFY
jgi:hypothetical protein